MYRTKRYEKEIAVKDYFDQYVNIEEFLEYCKACKNYDRVWSCPSYDFDQAAYWKRYEDLYILGYQIFFEDGTTEAESLRIMEEVKGRMSEELFAMEAAYPGSVSLSAGSCSVCGKGNCTRPQGEPCKYPDKMRYSIESIGGNVGKTVHDFLGIPLEWIEEGKVPGYFVLVGGLLKPKACTAKACRGQQSKGR